MPHAPAPHARLVAALLALACACASPAGPSRAGAEKGAPAAPAPGAPVHHDVRLTLDPAARRLSVEDTVTLSPELRARLGDGVALSLHAGLSPERVGPGSPLVRADGAAAADGGEQARVPLERFTVALAPGERTFTLRYAGELFHAIEQRGAEYARGMSESPGLVSPEGAVLSGASAWIPAIADELVTFALDATAPAGWEVIAAGARTRHERGEGQNVVRWECPEPQEEIVLAAGPLVERSRAGPRVVVQTFLHAEDPALADVYLDAGERYLALYEALLGPYPYAKFALVENFWETGYGMPSFTLLGPRVLRLPFLVHSSYPHEILHNWWGNGVYVDPARGNWVEGLTAYLADHLIQEQRGQGAEYRRTSLQRYADYVAAGAADFPVREFRARHDSVTQAVGYDKVLMVFHMLRQRMGDARFLSGLRRFYEEQRFRRASLDDLARVMGAAAGEDLGPWLAQWIDRPGAPAVRLEAAAARARDGAHEVELTLSQAQAGAPYEVDVPVVVTLASRPQAVRRTVRLSEPRQRFSIAVEATPARVDVDPELDAFRLLDPAELPPALSGAFGAREVVMVLPSEAPAEVRRAYEELAGRWRKDGTRVVTDGELRALPAGAAVWVLGWENRLRGAVASALAPYGAALGAEGLRLGSTTLDRREHAVVAAVRSPADPAQVVAFVGAERAKALEGLARKLPHYGKYGLLGFTGDEPENVAKEVWPVLGSPMTAALGADGRLPARGALPARAPLAAGPARGR